MKSQPPSSILNTALTITLLGALVTVRCCPSSAQVPREFGQLDVKIAVAKQHDPSVASPSVLVHFHGAPKIVEENFFRAGLPGVLATVNCRGLSSAYREPFENPALFAYVLQYVRQRLAEAGKLAERAEWDDVSVSSFSAGYGAVRELLKQQDTRRKIKSVVAADSIYASIHQAGGRRIVDETQMQPFLTLARMAIRGEKAFLISHSQLPVEAYASTVETADYLLRETGTTRRLLSPHDTTEFVPVSRASCGQFTVLGYAGGDGDAHLKHLKKISVLWQQLADD